MKFASLSLALIAGVLATMAPAKAEEFVIDTDRAHASINFRIKHLGFSWLTGRFDNFKGTFSFDEANPEASNVSVEIASLRLSVSLRDLCTGASIRCSSC